MPTSYCEAAIGVATDPQRSLYSSCEQAKAALLEELRHLRAEYPGAADDINGVLDELEQSGDEFLTYFFVGGVEWKAWYRPSDDRP